ncbi:pentatricopeptide repeat-containing protein At1g32415, mitochondrial-like [Wolffia australiana]
MIEGLSRHRRHAEALRLFIEMTRHRRSPPGVAAMAAAVHACLGLRLLRLCRQVHAQAAVRGAMAEAADDLSRRRLSGCLIQAYARLGAVDWAAWLFCRFPPTFCHTACWNSMIFGCSRSGRLGEARAWFDATPLPDQITATTMVSGYFDAGEVAAALELFRRTGGSDPVSWTAAISGLVQNERVEDAMGLFSEMMAAGVLPLDRTLAALLGGAGSAACLDMGRQLHGLAEKTRPKLDTVAGNALVAMYAKSGDTAAAIHAFSIIPTKDIVSWNAAIVGLSHHGQALEALELFRDMPMQPDDVSFLGALQACTHVGMVQLGGEIIGSMAAPGAEHYACMAHALGQGGLAVEAEELLLRLPGEPAVAAWAALVAACREDAAAVAERAARRVLKLDPNNVPTKIRLRRLRGEERGGCKGKMPGMSWVVVKGRTHAFICGDSSHPQNKEIRALLSWL